LLVFWFCSPAAGRDDVQVGELGVLVDVGHGGRHVLERGAIAGVAIARS
jgi:hypothetical protein